MSDTHTLAERIKELENQLTTLREALKILSAGSAEVESSLQVGLRGDTRHWTQRPENTAKVRAMIRKGKRTRRERS